jgi:hypothetical protein
VDLIAVLMVDPFLLDAAASSLSSARLPAVRITSVKSSRFETNNNDKYLLTNDKFRVMMGNEK